MEMPRSWTPLLIPGPGRERGLSVYARRLGKLRRVELQQHCEEKQINGFAAKQSHPDSGSFLRFLCSCCFSSVSQESEMSRKRVLLPFIRPEPIIMTSPQGRIHFNYHPLCSVCVRRPGNHFYALGKRYDRKPVRFIYLFIYLFSGNKDICVTHCENWDMFVFRREIWWDTSTGCPGQIVSLSSHLLDLLRVYSVCVCVQCICVQLGVINISGIGINGMKSD